MLQADASPHDWFGTGKNEALHGFIPYADGLSIFSTKSKAEELLIEEELNGISERKTQFGTIRDALRSMAD